MICWEQLESIRAASINNTHALSGCNVYKASLSVSLKARHPSKRSPPVRLGSFRAPVPGVRFITSFFLAARESI